MTLQTQIVQDLSGLLYVAVTAGLGYVGVKAKAWFAAHTTAQVAAAGDSALSTLSGIVSNVVQDFNQTVVNQAKANGSWTPAMGAQVKQDAIAAVKSQASNLLTLGKSVLGNVDSLIGSMIETAVAKHKVTVTPATPMAPATPTAPTA